MDLLLSNDDGISAEGLAVMERAISGLGHTLWVVAPDRPRSAQSHALTLHDPLRAKQVGERRWAVSGTPADCTYLALHELLPRPPALVLSGINHGSNLSNDVLYSGTVAAAMEGALHDVPAVAFSLHPTAAGAWHWDTAEQVVARIVPRLLGREWPRHVMLNVNVPDVVPAELQGIRTVTLGHRRYGPQVNRRTDPRGGTYFWLGGEHESFHDEPGSDGPTLERGFATVTPLHPDMTRYEALPAVAAWLEDS